MRVYIKKVVGDLKSDKNIFDHIGPNKIIYCYHRLQYIITPQNKDVGVSLFIYQ